MPRPNKTQLEVLRKLNDSESKRLVRMDGGYWTLAELTRIGTLPSDGVPTWHCGTRTVRSMEKKGLLARLWLHNTDWRDDLGITESGKCALELVVEVKHKKTRTEPTLETPPPPPHSTVLRLTPGRRKIIPLRDLREDYWNIAKAHHSISRVDYHLGEGSYVERSMSSVFGDLRKLRELIKQAQQFKHPREISLAFKLALAIHDILERGERREEAVREVLAQERYAPLRALWYPIYLGFEWTNDLALWADTVIGGQYESTYGAEEGE